MEEGRKRRKGEGRKKGGTNEVKRRRKEREHGR